MGRNGMGKSTLIRTIMGLVPAAEGRVVLAGTDAARPPTFARARLGIAYVPEGRGIFAQPDGRRKPRHRGAAGPRRHRRHWTIARVLELFPRLAERLPTAATSSRAASSRCSPSAARC